jgi:hypothetical protein
VDRLGAEGESHREGDVAFAAGVGEPVPAVNALAPDEQIGRERFDGLGNDSGLAGTLRDSWTVPILAHEVSDEMLGLRVDRPGASAPQNARRGLPDEWH